MESDILYFISKSGDVCTFEKDWGCTRQRMICLSEKIYIPMARILYYRISGKITEYPHLACTTQSIRIFAQEESLKRRMFIFNDISSPIFSNNTISFISRDQEKQEQSYHYFPVENVISLENIKKGEDI